MTREEILNMEAGREMDALVAEQVMGYERTADVMPYGFGNAWLLYYTTDIAAAWEVAKKILDDYSESYYMFGYPLIDADWNVCDKSWAKFYIDDDEFAADAPGFDGLPLAICRAALLATLEEL